MPYWIKFKYLSHFNNLHNLFQIKGEPPHNHRIWECCEPATSPSHKKIISLHQIHSDKIIHIKDERHAEEILALPNQIKGDGLLTSVKGIYLRIKVADCIPLYMYNPTGPMIGLIHVGRRGAISGIVENAITTMQETWNCDISQTVCFIGPSISKENYIVGEEVANQYPADFIEPVDPGKFKLDLKGFTKAQLIQMNIPESNISTLPFCTFEEEFFESYRRDGENAGRMQALVGL
ncbi:polyphenol oxidase family protein [bacterium]|nr:polyphenol oxidase family protein [bacterium]